MLARIVFGRGVLDESTRIVRIMVAFILLVAGAALTFVQLGFVAVGLPNGSTGYILVLLEVVALGSLLLGTLPGTGLGLLVGCVLLLHARILPLDPYELTFITPTTSVVMFGLSGFLLGVMFAFALRKNPLQGRRVLYIAIICFTVSALYSAGFFAHVVTSLAKSISALKGPSITELFAQQAAGSTASHLGDIGVLIGCTGSCMTILCILIDMLARKMQAREGALGLRTVFGVWLGVVVTVTFMVISAVSFAVSTLDELWDAETNMDADATYILDQIEQSEDRLKLFVDFATSSGFDAEQLKEEDYDKLIMAISSNDVLNAYSVDKHGTAIVTYDNILAMTNDDRLDGYEDVNEALGSDTMDAIETSLKEGRMQRIVRGSFANAYGDSAAGGALASNRPEIAYLIAKRITIDYADGAQLTTTSVIIQPSEMVFGKRPSIMAWMVLSSFALLLAVFAIVFQLVNRVVVRRIDEENDALAQITDGQLDATATAGGSREFESLSNGINVTVSALKNWISEAETRMDAELATAHAIQESALPRTFPPFPEIAKFDIFASMNAAKEVGGDFYDFFLVGDECDGESGKLGFVIADVSGKGVPAALFMMRAKALIRDYVCSGLELGEAVEEANRQLEEGNDAGMFVTAWVGVLDYGTGHVDYVNAGHNPPLLWTRESGWQWLTEKSGTPLGLFDFPYQAYELDCKEGDMFLLYTDGVTEAYDADENLYGEDRLLAVAQKEEGKRAHELLEAVRADVDAHAEGAEQSDDITILTLQNGVAPDATAMLEVPADVKQLNRVNDFLHDELNMRLCPQHVQSQLDIAVEELFVNVCHYAYPDATPEEPGRVRITRTYHAKPSSITVEIIDEGIPYDPLAKPDAVTPDDIMDVPIGGLGILMAKNCTDEMRYARVGDSNVVTLVKKW